MRRGEGKGSDTEKEGCDPLDNSPMLAGLPLFDQFVQITSTPTFDVVASVFLFSTTSLYFFYQIKKQTFIINSKITRTSDFIIHYLHN